MGMNYEKKFAGKCIKKSPLEIKTTICKNEVHASSCATDSILFKSWAQESRWDRVKGSDFRNEIKKYSKFHISIEIFFLQNIYAFLTYFFFQILAHGVRMRPQQMMKCFLKSGWKSSAQCNDWPPHKLKHLPAVLSFSQKTLLFLCCFSWLSVANVRPHVSHFGLTGDFWQFFWCCIRKYLDMKGLLQTVHTRKSESEI